MEEEIAEGVRKHGWFALAINDHAPPFLYSIGLMQTFDHPEFVIFGLESAASYPILAAMIDDIRHGASYGEPGSYSGILADGHQIGIRRVDPSQHPSYLGYAMGFCALNGGRLAVSSVGDIERFAAIRT